MRHYHFGCFLLSVVSACISSSLAFSNPYSSSSSSLSSSLKASVTSNDDTTVSAQRRRVSLVTGASGYVGREVVHTLLSDDDDDDDDDVCDDIICLVRPSKVQQEQSYWSQNMNEQNAKKKKNIRVMPYDMLDGGETLDNALHSAYHDNNNDSEEEEEEEETEYCLYHLACIFGPTEQHIQTAHDTIKGVQSTLQTLSKYSSPSCKLILTSSMAAVRGTNQIPLNQKFYTHKDWNTKSKLEDDNWGSSYQWSKMESERVAWELAKELDVKMVSLCPSFIFGPSSLSSSSSSSSCSVSSNSYSLTLVNQWIRGQSPVQSRLCIDVRDVAKAHVHVGKQRLTSNVWGKRFILSTERRVSSTDMAKALQKVSQKAVEEDGMDDFNPNDIYADTTFQGGAIKIGDKEVECEDRLKKYFGGLVCRSVEETMEDMGRALLFAEKMKKKQYKEVIKEKETTG